MFNIKKRFKLNKILEKSTNIHFIFKKKSKLDIESKSNKILEKSTNIFSTFKKIIIILFEVNKTITYQQLFILLKNNEYTKENFELYKNKLNKIIKIEYSKNPENFNFDDYIEIFKKIIKLISNQITNNSRKNILDKLNELDKIDSSNVVKINSDNKSKKLLLDKLNELDKIDSSNVIKINFDDKSKKLLFNKFHLFLSIYPNLDYLNKVYSKLGVSKEILNEFNNEMKKYKINFSKNLNNTISTSKLEKMKNENNKKLLLDKLNELDKIDSSNVVKINFDDKSKKLLFDKFHLFLSIYPNLDYLNKVYSKLGVSKEILNEFNNEMKNIK